MAIFLTNIILAMSGNTKTLILLREQSIDQLNTSMRIKIISNTNAERSSRRSRIFFEQVQKHWKKPLNRPIGVTVVELLTLNSSTLSESLTSPSLQKKLICFWTSVTSTSRNSLIGKNSSRDLITWVRRRRLWREFRLRCRSSAICFITTW